MNSNCGLRMPEFVTPNNVGYINEKIKRIPPHWIRATMKAFESCYRKARFLTFSEVFRDKDAHATVIQHHNGVAGNPILDLPFEVCMFDGIDGLTPMMRNGRPYMLLALMVHELEPGRYEYFAMEAGIEPETLDKERISLQKPHILHVMPDDEEDVLFDYHVATRAMVDRLKASDNVVGTIKTKHHVKVGQAKIGRNIKSVKSFS